MLGRNPFFPLKVLLLWSCVYHVSAVKSKRQSGENMSVGLRHSVDMAEDNKYLLSWTPRHDDVVMQIEVNIVTWLCTLK